jgi:hypothetical protein
MFLLNTITNESDTDSFGNFLLESLKKSNSIKIASGYVGIDAFKKTEGLLRNIVETGGAVTLIFGLGKWEGISPKLEPLLRIFHDYVHKLNSQSGVYFCQKDKYHGKIYIFQNSTHKWVTVGSSNFSPTGFGEWNEANVKLSDEQTLKEVEEYFHRLLSENAKPINLLTFPSRKKEKTTNQILEKITTPSDFRNLPIAFKLQIRITSGAHVNLFASRGRINRKTGIYTKRPWYEVEIGILISDVKKNLTTILPNKLAPYHLTLVDEFGNIFNANFKRKTTDKNDFRTMHNLGADFMTGKGEKGDRGKNGRKQLGFFIKDRLIDAGLLRYGEVITEDILDMYGNHFLEFRRVPEKNDYFYITFDAA